MTREKQADALVLHIAREPQTGVWTLMKELATWQQQAGIDSQIVIFAPQDKLKSYVEDLFSCGVKIHSFPISKINYSYWFLLFDNRLSAFISKNPGFRNYKKIVLQFHNANLSGLFLPIRLKQYPNIRVLAVFHGTPLVFPKPGKLKLFLHRAVGNRLRYADKIISVSEAGVEEAIHIFSYQRHQFAVIPNGLSDPGILHVTKTKINHENPFTVGFVGSLTEGKRWNLVVDAVAMLMNKGIPLRAVIVGSGPDEGKVKELANLNQSWLDFRGFIPNAGRTIIPTFDVLVLPSSYEGVPMTIIEALACGVPVIATPISDIPKLIVDSECGFLVEQDAKIIAEKIEQLWKDNHYDLYSDFARKHYLRNYTISVCGEKYNDLYNTLFDG